MNTRIGPHEGKIRIDFHHGALVFWNTLSLGPMRRRAGTRETSAAETLKFISSQMPLRQRRLTQPSPKLQALKPPRLGPSKGSSEEQLPPPAASHGPLRQCGWSEEAWEQQGQSRQLTFTALLQQACTEPFPVSSLLSPITGTTL